MLNSTLTTRLLLATTFLASSLFVSPVLNAQAQDVDATANTRIVTEKVTQTVKPLAIDNRTSEVKPAVQRFVELINQARVDLALKRPQDASPKIDNALKMAQFIRQNSTMQDMYRETRISSGVVTYNNKDTTGNYYMPFETGPVTLKSVTDTPSSKPGNNGIAVTGAEVAYLTVDLSGPAAETYLSQAKAAITQGNLKDADQNLATLMDTVAKTQTSETLPYDKANNNLALALRFLKDNNYKATQYALAHAAEAIKAMQGDARFDAKAVTKNYDRITQIHDLVMQQSTNAAQKARTQIMAAQDEIKVLQPKS